MIRLGRAPQDVTPVTVYEGMPSWTDGREAVLDGHRTVHLDLAALKGYIAHLQQHVDHLAAGARIGQVLS